MTTTLLELLQAHADGQVVESRSHPHDNTLWGPWQEVVPDVNSELVFADFFLGIRHELRIRPTLKPVDLSVLIDSGIDCEFWCGDPRHWYVSPDLSAITTSKEVEYANNRLQVSDRCRPRLNHWHTGANCGLSTDGTVERLRKAGFNVTYDVSASLFYVHSDKPLADGRCWPWEVK